MIHPCFNYLVGLFGLSLSLVACDGSDVNEMLPDYNAKQSIVFGSQLSKAPVTDVNSMGNFKVWGWAHDDKAYYNLFNKTEVTPSGAYKGVQYWMNGCLHDFYGVYPAWFPASVSQDGTLTVKDLDAMAMGENAIDFMTASYKQSTPYIYQENVNPKPVKMSFSHELAKVEFFVKSEQEVRVIAELYGISRRGSLTKQYQGTSNSWISSWNLNPVCTEEETPFKTDPKKPLVVKKNEEPYLFGGVMLLQPQQLIVKKDSQLGATFHLTYIYKDGTKEEKTIYLNNLNNITKWEAGKAYRYEIIIPKQTFDVEIIISVTDWNNRDIPTTL